MQRDTWPLIGRDDLVDRVMRHLLDPACDGVLLVGSRGAGTTRVLHEVHGRVRTTSRRTAKAVASQANCSTPFAALAPTFPVDAPTEPLALFQHLRGVYGSPRAEERPVICIDDIRWVDDASLGLLTQLLAARLVVLVATVHDHAELPEALDSIERSCAIRREAVLPLDRVDTADLVYAVMDNAVEGTTLARLVEASNGYPQFLAEMIEGSLTTGALTKELGTWTLDGAPTVTARLSRMLEERLGQLLPAQRDLVELLAHAQPVTLDALSVTGLLSIAVDLETQGIVAVSEEDDALVELAHPLIATVVVNRTSPLRRRALLPQLITLVSASAEHRGEADLVRLTSWRVESGDDVADGELARAGALAARTHELEVAVELTRAMRVPTYASLLTLAEALHELCRFDEADAAMAQADALANGDAELLRLAVLRHRVLLWGRHDRDGSVQVLQDTIAALDLPLARDLGRTAWANAMVFTGRAPEVAGVLAAMEGDGTFERAAAYYPRSMAEMVAGRVEAAVSIAREGVALRRTLPPDAPIAHPLVSELALGTALVEAGLFEESEVVLGNAYTQATEHALTQPQIWAAMTRARGYLYRGDLTESRLWFTEVRSVSAASRFEQGLRVGLTGLAITSAQLGDLATALEAEHALRAMPDDGGLRHAMRYVANAWVANAQGRRDRALAELRTGLDETRARHELALTFEFLHELVRLGGDATAAAVEMQQLRCDGALNVARLQFVRGVAEGDHRGLAAAEKQFAAIGAWISAAEAAAELARVLHDDGRVRDAQGAGNRSRAYLLDLGPVHTPMLGDAPAGSDLSPREREITALAARGAASKVIAQRLGLSVRTVSNHLQNAYLKLGISGRDELVDALGLDSD